MTRQDDYKLLADENLLTCLYAGDGFAFEEIYNRYWKPLLSSAHKRLQDTAASMDVVQNVFIDLWARKESLQIHNLKAFLFQAIRFQVYKSLLHSRKTKPFLNLFDEMFASGEAADLSLMDKELQSLLQQWIEALPEKRKLIFLLHFEENLTTKEIAVKLGLSQKTVQNQLRIAHKLIEKHMKEIIVMLVVAAQTP